MHLAAAPLVAACRVSRLQQRGPAALRRAASRMSVPPRAADAPPVPNFFRDIYVKFKEDAQPVPWDIAAPQPSLVALPAGTLHGRCFDVGSGTGDNALWLAGVPGVTEVAAIDLSPTAVAEASARLAAAPAPTAKLSFAVADVFALPAELTGFDTLLDSAVFHCIGDDDAQKRYLAAVTPRIKMRGRAVMLVFSDRNDEEPWIGPRRISEAHARAMWTAAGWRIDSIYTSARYMDNLKRYNGAGGHALLMLATRVA